MEPAIDFEVKDWRENRKSTVQSISSDTSVITENTDIILSDGYVTDGPRFGVTYIGNLFKSANETKNLDTLTMKVVEMSSLDAAIVRQLHDHGLKILQFLKRTPFKNIIDVYDIYTLENGKIFIMEEYLLTTLEQLLLKNEPVKDKELRAFGEPLCNAILFLHNAGIAHQNIAPHNIYFTSNNKLKLVSLEYAIICWDSSTDEVIMQRCQLDDVKPGRCVAPEVTTEVYDPMKADIYSFGVIVSYIALKRYPFEVDRDDDFFTQWTSAKYDLTIFLLPITSDLILRCIDYDVKKRLSIREIIMHPFFTDTL